ncbi:prepilin peptidase [Patescibacteria group bacterium AH-259-L07]|nr:prepilin peptidase [Patescibacteria group bacterium AH-259-L07]
MLILIFYISVFFIGLAFGSFLNCVVYRLYKKRSLWGRSQCPHCKKTIVWHDNIPLLSFLVLRRRCRYCHKVISWQYPFIELVMGLLFVFSIWQLNNQLSIISYQFSVPTLAEYAGFILSIFKDWVVFFTLVFIFVYDIKYLKIEDIVLLPATGIVIALSVIIAQLPGSSVFVALGHSVSKFVVFKNLGLAMVIPVVFFVLQYILTKGKGVGLGDVRIGLFMGAALGIWYNVVIALFFAYIIGAIISGILLIQKKKTIKSQIPLGPFLAIGTLIAYLYSQQIINWYFL